MVPQLFLGGPAGLLLGLVVSVLVVTLGTYFGVLLALQSFFERDSWKSASPTGAAGGPAPGEGARRGADRDDGD